MAKKEKDFVSEASDKAKEILNDVKDDSKKFTKSDIESGKLMALLSYIGILALIPYFVENKNKYVRYHALNGMNLFILELIISASIGIVYSIFAGINGWFVFSFIKIPFAFVELFFVLISVIGIVNVCNEEAKELPLIGKLRLIKK